MGSRGSVHIENKPIRSKIFCLKTEPAVLGCRELHGSVVPLFWECVRQQLIWVQLQLMIGIRDIVNFWALCRQSLNICLRLDLACFLIWLIHDFLYKPWMFVWCWLTWHEVWTCTHEHQYHNIRSVESQSVFTVKTFHITKSKRDMDCRACPLYFVKLVVTCGCSM